MTTARQEGGPARRPLILMTPDIEMQAGAPTEALYALRANYAEAIGEAGGLPLILPYETQALAHALDLADGVLITGTLPGAEAGPERRAFELALIEHAIRTGKPLLGICHGMQLIGEWLGGTFVRSLPVSRFRVAARAPDGLIEAFEGETPGFCLGIQWHPEYRLSEFDRAIFRLFVEQSGAGVLRSARACPVRTRLAALGLELPEASTPPGAFVGAIRTGNIVTVSGQVPLKDGAVLRTGHLGADVSLEDGRDSARWALLNALAQLERIAGGLDRIEGFVRLAGYVAATAEFTQHGAVVDGGSELLRELFPECWPHARIAIGVGSLPRGVPVEIELTALLGEAEG
jgi:gamma-glutamyl-gamma-aminobutyrate hydrolase PuuD/enamine deaminase RidA (YjgF/YER057c/UK114 family)